MAKKDTGLLMAAPRPRTVGSIVAAVLAVIVIGLFAVVASKAQALSVWSSSDTPAVASDPDTGAIELGVKFRSSVDTMIAGVKFYKGAGNTGTHTGSLWSKDGTRLATVTFTNESASGWQTAHFAAPVAIAANTTYVVSYFAPNGHYSVTERYFSDRAVTNGTLTALQSGTDGDNGVYVYGGSAFPSNSYNGSNYWVDVITGEPDLTAPTGSMTAPAHGQTVSGAVTMTASASDAIGVKSVQFQVDGVNVGAVATTAPYTATWNTLAVANGSHTLRAVVTDTSGNVMTTAEVIVTVNNQSTPPTETVSLWHNDIVPRVLEDSDTAAVELGVKFRSTVATQATGVKFYKGAANTGTHVGSLWAIDGTRLASVTFTNESASGWQTAQFATPVAIAANTTYVVSYHAPNGRYSADSSYFTFDAHTNGTLTAPNTNDAGGNGVYAYGAAGSFPTASYGAANYWVDVITGSAQAPEEPTDTTAPQVVSTTPVDGAFDIARDGTISAVLSEALDTTTLTQATMFLKNAAGETVPSTVAYDASTRRASLVPAAALQAMSEYTVTMTTGIKDTSGNALSAAYSWSFTTEASIAPTAPLAQGHGGPVLLVTKSGQSFTEYYAEILRAEGLNSFTTVDISTVTSAVLASHDTVILGDMALTSAQVTLFSDWVNDGGSLIAMHPDEKLAELLGLNAPTGSTADTYLKVDTTKAPGAGIVSETMQYHGAADLYTTKSGTTTVAHLYTTATTSSQHPAVTLRSVGAGHAAAFVYDLARSVVYTHQGNPNWSGDDRDGNGVIRPNDLFYGAKAGDMQADYVDLSKVAIPQADEQQRLLANMIIELNKDKQPLPRLAYFPYNNKAVVVLAADDHSTGSGVSELDNMIALSKPDCVAADWECIRSTSLMYTSTPMTNEQAARYAAQGFDFGVHATTGCANWTPQSLAISLDADLSGFRSKYTSLPQQTVNRIHCIAWSTYTDAVKVGLERGIRVDMNYYYWPGSWVQDRPGYMTGSGMTMRFADIDGSMIDVYQAPSHLVNESGQTWPRNIDIMLDRALGPEGYYGALGTHYDYSDQFARQLITSARARNVPMVSGKQLLDWSDGRNNSYFSAGEWNGATYQFAATMDARTREMGRVMLPTETEKGVLLAVAHNDQPVAFTTETMKGVTYAVFTAKSGNYQATYGADSVAPTILDVTPAAQSANVKVGTTATMRFSEPLNQATVTEAHVRLLAGETVVPATVSYDTATHTVMLTPTATLRALTTYHVVVTTAVTDAHGNAIADEYVSSFTTGEDTQSIWAPNEQTVSHANDTADVELGLRFQSSQAGFITGIQFYKNSNDSQTRHAVTLWDGSGQAVATATTSSETQAGWQLATFTTPVAVQANSAYTASYRSVGGQYTYTSGGLASSVTRGPLTALGSGGVYQYGGGYPTGSFGATNYWVDVVFRAH